MVILNLQKRMLLFFGKRSLCHDEFKTICGEKSVRCSALNTAGRYSQIWTNRDHQTHRFVLYTVKEKTMFWYEPFHKPHVHVFLTETGHDPL